MALRCDRLCLRGHAFCLYGQHHFRQDGCCHGITIRITSLCLCYGESIGGGVIRLLGLKTNIYDPFLPQGFRTGENRLYDSVLCVVILKNIFLYFISEGNRRNLQV